jgi:hypothetical protein
VTTTRTARCDNVIEPTDTFTSLDGEYRCAGILRFADGDLQAACDTCGAWCGYLVADYIDDGWSDPLREATQTIRRFRDLHATALMEMADLDAKHTRMVAALATMRDEWMVEPGKNATCLGRAADRLDEILAAA